MSCEEVSIGNTFSSKVGAKGTFRVLLLHCKYLGVSSKRINGSSRWLNVELIVCSLLKVMGKWLK